MKNEVLEHLEEALHFAGTEEICTAISKLISEINIKETEYEWVDFETGECICCIGDYKCIARRYSKEKWQCKIEKNHDMWFQIAEASCLRSLRDVEKFYTYYIELIG